MIVGAGLAWSLVDAKHVVRTDGSKVILMKQPTWKSEIIGMGQVLVSDWYIAFLFPMFLASNWFYTYHFQDVNTPFFNLRTRSLNGVLYWTSQIIGAGIFGFALDSPMFRRPTRAKAALAALFVLTFGKGLFLITTTILISYQQFGVVDTLSSSDIREPLTLRRYSIPPRRIGPLLATLVPCFSTCFTGSLMVSYLALKACSHMAPPFQPGDESKIYQIRPKRMLTCDPFSGMADHCILAYGFAEQQFPQARQFRRVL